MMLGQRARTTMGKRWPNVGSTRWPIVGPTWWPYVEATCWPYIGPMSKITLGQRLFMMLGQRARTTMGKRWPNIVMLSGCLPLKYSSSCNLHYSVIPRWSRGKTEDLNVRGSLYFLYQPLHLLVSVRSSVLTTFWPPPPPPPFTLLSGQRQYNH